MFDETADVSAESSTATDAQADPSQATSEPAQPQAPQQPPFHQHPRWQQMLGENRNLKGTVQQLTQRLTAIEQRAQQGQVSPDQERQYREAGDALLQIIRQHPELRPLLEMAARAQQWDQASQNVNQIGMAQRRAATTQGRSHIESLAKQAGLLDNIKPDNRAAYLQRLTRSVAMEAASMPGGQERYEAGDYTVLDEAFKALSEGFLSTGQKAAAAQLVDTKNKTQALPPRPRGSAPGPQAPMKFERGKEREYEADLTRRATEMLQGS